MKSGISLVEEFKERPIFVFQSNNLGRKSEFLINPASIHLDIQQHYNHLEQLR
ncbi:MAG: hypothetical protein R3F53_16985 [Gammaproteobacteria bacterium]